METKVFKLGKKQPKGILIFAGILFNINGVFAIINDSIPPYGIIAGVLMIIYGLLCLFKPELATYSLKKVEIDDESVSIKPSILGKKKKYPWVDINGITLDSYYISFDIGKGQESVRYDSEPETSMDIKNTLKEIGMEKGIPVTGG